MGGIQHRISLYGDDILLYMLLYSRLVDVITLFGCFSGYKINFSKSLAMPMGSHRDRTNTLPSFPFKWSITGFVYLGIYITPLFHDMFKANFNPPRLHKEGPGQMGSTHDCLSLLGRVSIIKMNIFHIFNIYYIPYR